MTFTDKLNRLMAERGINRSQLSKLSGVPYTTITSFYDKGTDKIKLSTLKCTVKRLYKLFSQKNRLTNRQDHLTVS